MKWDVAVALVLSNWGNVLRAIQMASSKNPLSPHPSGVEVVGSDEIMVVKIPRPDVDSGGDGEEGQDEDGKVPLPTTLVRIPVGEEERGQDGSGDGREGSA